MSTTFSKEMQKKWGKMPPDSGGAKPYLSKVWRSQVFSVIISFFRLSVVE